MLLLAACACAMGVLFACSSPAPVPDFETQQPPVRSSATKPPPPPPTTDAADAGSADADAVCKTVPPNNNCGLVPQCGCGSNETCDVTNQQTGATSCVTAGGGTLGRPCTQSGDCIAGLTCIYGACRPYCSSARTPCTTPGTDLCVEVLGANSQPEPNMTVCTIACDPRLPSAVCGTNMCLWFPTYYSPEKVSDCNFPGTIDAEMPCSAAGNDSECKPAMACVQHPKYGPECERWCRIGMNSDCAASGPAFTCKDVFGANAPVIGGVKEGICQD